MKLFTAAAVAILLSSGMAYAQTSGGGTTNETTGAINQKGGSGTDASNYLAGPNIHRFYQNEQMEELRSEAEMQSVWEAMSDADRENLRTACVSNEDPRFNDLCTSIGTM